MPFSPHVLKALEDALSDGFEYHAQLDSYLSRAGVDGPALRSVREAADAKARASTRQWAKAPKRYVVREAIDRLNGLGRAGEVTIANLITALCKDSLPSNPNARAAVETLKRQLQEDGKERAAKDVQEREERERRDREKDTAKAREAEKRQEARAGLHEQFMGLYAQADAQARGFALERLLNELFEFEGLAPRRSFRLVGEQIDGSFAWRDQTHLLEARWTQQQVAGSGFAEIIFKTSGKSENTRGLMVSINGYSQDGLQSLKGKGALRFVCIDGTHLMRALQPGSSLRNVLIEVWRHADETGNAYLPASEMSN